MPLTSVAILIFFSDLQEKNMLFDNWHVIHTHNGLLLDGNPYSLDELKF